MMKTKILVLAICVLSSQIAYGQYDNDVPPIYLPKATKGLSKTVSHLQSNSLLSNPTSQAQQNDAVAGAVSVGSEGCSCGGHCGGGGSCGPHSDAVGRSFFGGRSGSGNNAGAGKIRFSVKRGPQTCDQCGADNRTFLQRILPVSISLQSNEESRYIGFFGGYHDMQDIRATDRLLDFDESFILGFTRGRRFCDRIRLESEFAIRNAPTGQYFEGSFVGEEFVPTATFDGEDGFVGFSSMRNVLIDFNGVAGATKPYVGVGLGGIFVTGDYINDSIGRADWINDVAFSYQFIIGATRRLNQNSEAYAEFRHFGTSGLELENDAGAPFTDFAFQNNTVVFGMRFDRPLRRCCGN